MDPPQAMRDAATALAFPVPRLEVRGHDELDRRVTRAYAMFIEPGEYTFKATAVVTPSLLAPALVGLAMGHGHRRGRDRRRERLRRARAR